jgi:hypothetical protein
MHKTSHVNQDITSHFTISLPNLLKKIMNAHLWLMRKKAEKIYDLQLFI